jgi:hypothetical protein
MKELGRQLHIAVDSIVAEDSNGNGNGNGATQETAELAEESARVAPEPQPLTKISVVDS